MSDYFLPGEIIIEILIKLPVKSLIRFTSVCKQWRCLIRSPSFISTHLFNTTQNQTFFLERHDHVGQEQFMVIPKRGPLVINSEFLFKCQMGFFRIFGSCDGLVCLSDTQSIVIWNPAIRNHVVLPPSLVHHQFTLGFGVVSNFYKVVRLVYRSELLQAEIFCLGGEGTWRELTGFDHVRGLVPKFMRFPIFFKGFLHWIARELIGKRNSILRFHVGKEVFGEIMLPHELGWARATIGTRVSLSMMGESLGAFKSYGQFDNRACDVWMMKDYGVKESWTRLYRIDFRGFERVIGFWGSSEALVVVLGQELAIYNPETKRIRHAGFFGNIVSFYVNDYKESLVFLGAGYSRDSGEEVIA